MQIQFRPGARALVAVQPYGDSFPEALKRLSEDPKIQVFECETATDASSIAQHVDGALILTYLGGPEDVGRQLPMIKALSRGARARRIRFVAVTSLEEPALLAKIAGAGFSELIPEPVSGKGLAFKLERHLRAVPPAQGAEQGDESQGGNKKKRGAASTDPNSAAAPETAKKRNSVIRVPPLEIESDVWTSDGSGARRIGGRWVIRMGGPPPSHGHWEQTDAMGSEKDVRARYWRWTPTDPENDPFIREQGAWIFRGQKPEFQEDVWAFIDKCPELTFIYESEGYGSKLKIDESGSLLLAEDSQQAKKAMLQIREELEKLEWDAQGGSADEKDGEPLAAESSSVVREVAPLQLQSDCWLLSSRRPRKVMGRWLARLVGPPPKCGRWVEMEAETVRNMSLEPAGDGESYFRWIPTDEAGDPFLKEQGFWTFRGVQPRFEVDAWIFAGKGASLGFYYEGDCYGLKLAVQEDGALLVAKDSPAALNALPAIEAALEKVIHQDTKEPEDAASVLVASDEADDEEAEEGGDPETAKDRPSFWHRQEQFGVPGGKWEFASANAQRKKWFVYVSLEIVNGTVNDVKTLKSYWLFEGLDRPLFTKSPSNVVAGGKEWLFRGWEPEEIGTFAELPKVVRNYLLDRAPQPVYTDTQVTVKRGGTQDYRERREAGDGPEDYHERPATKYAARELAKDVEGSLRPDQIFGSPVPLRAVRDAALSRKVPVVSPLALAFLVSELVCRRDLLREQVAQRYCAYVSSAVGGLRTELWANTGGVWMCVATSDGSGGKHRETLTDSEAGVRAGATGTRIAQLEGLGALVVEGGGEFEIPQAYVENAARMSVGLLRYFVAGQVNPAANTAAA